LNIAKALQNMGFVAVSEQSAYRDCISNADPFKHTRQYCEEKHYDWREIRQMINEYKGELVLDDAEIVNGY